MLISGSPRPRSHGYGSLGRHFQVFLNIHSIRIPWWLRELKRLPAMREIRVQSLGWEDPLEKELATHSSILVWKITWTEEPGGLKSMGSQKSQA